MSERKEAFMRIFVFIVSGIVLVVWRLLVYVLIIINLIYVIFSGKRLKEIAEFSEVWNTQWYVFQRYIIFVSNRRPIPFGSMEKSLSNYEKHPHNHYKKKR